MAKTGIWFHYHSGEDSLPREVISRSLTEVGLKLYPLDLSTPSGSGIFLFNEMTQEVCECLNAFSHKGLDRVLAVAVQGTALGGGGAWRLLQAGASDVFAWDKIPNPSAPNGQPSPTA